MMFPREVAPDGTHGPFETANVAAAVIDANGTVIGWTGAAERLLGYGAPEILDRSAATLLARPEDAARAAEVAEVCGTRESWGGLVGARHRDGHRIEVGLRVTAMSDTDDRKAWLVSATDVSKAPSWAVSGEVLEGFLTRSPLGMAVLTPDLRYVWMNDTLERYGGVPRDERLGRRMSESLPGLNTEALEEQMRRVLETGVPVVDYEYRGWTWADPHEEHAFSTSFFRLDTPDGNPLGVCYMGMDVTDRWRARERLALLSEASAFIGGTLNVMRTAQELADFSVPRLADFVTVDLLEAVLHGDEPASGRADGAYLVRAGQQSIHEGVPESVIATGDLIDAPRSSPYFESMVAGAAVLEPFLDPATAPWIREDPARARSIAEFGMHSVMWVPLSARGTVLGVATFVRMEHPQPFEEDDLVLAQELVGRAAVWVENARRYTREHEAALALQRSLLPRGLNGGTAMEVASRYLPADVREGVGGDWFDVIQLSGARVALVVGDVVGHGLNAAATMGRLRTAVQTLADMDLPPDELLAHLDDLVIRLAEEKGDDEPVATAVLGATCLYAVYDPVTQLCTMARAGHPPPAVVAPGGKVTFLDLPAGPPLGLGSLPFESAEVSLPEGSLIALYTDGLIESAGQDIDVGLSRLSDVLAQSGLPPEELCSAVVNNLLTGPQTDDVALLLARPHALGADRVASWDIPTDPAVVASARELAVRQLLGWGLEDLVMTTELVVSELVTNAIR
uniref:SpoIIE family protein phosphatase n=1 Tax=Streptomyces graminilatus TaxID=1464070 RepID=UPI0006E24E9F